MFQAFPEIKEALLSNRIQAGFLVAPMAIALRSQGAPIKIVYLGHRYGSSVVVRKDGPIRSPADLKGRTMAIPSRYSDERLVLLRAMKSVGLGPDDVRLVEMPPADVTSALEAGAIDGFSMGEPFPSQAEMSGVGRTLFRAREYWPDYISCVLVVRDELIEKRPGAVQVLVDGIARSGHWLDEGVPNREYAAEFVGRYYFHQPPELLRWALLNPIDRVVYTRLTPLKPDFDFITGLMAEYGLLEAPIPFEEYVDPTFAEGGNHDTAWKYRPWEDGDASSTEQ